MLEDLQLFYGEVNESRAQLYARLEGPANGPAMHLAGAVRGPRAETARTLPTTVELIDLGPGDSLLARAVVPDPVFWSPDVPSVYDVTVELREGDQLRETVTRSLGLRHFGVRGASLYLSGRRWVMRGVIAERVDDDQLDQLQETNSTIVTRQADQSLCDLASRRGLPVSVMLEGDASSIAPRMRRLARWPAVVAAIVDGECSAKEIRRAAPNIVRAWRARQIHQAWPIPQWADVAAVWVDDAGAERFLADCRLPVLAIRPVSPKMELSDRRVACDHLQRDLAKTGDFAGYIV